MNATHNITEAEVRDALLHVMDPEIPNLSIVDLGIVRNVSVGDGIEVELMPTFVGCPAAERIAADVRRAAACRAAVRWRARPGGCERGPDRRAQNVGIRGGVERRMPVP